MIREIVRSVRCELQRTLTAIITKDFDNAKRRASGRRYADFLENWGAQAALNLTFIEKTTVNPTASVMPASPAAAILTLADGVSGSSQATRIERSNVFYTVKELYRPDQPVCLPGSCIASFAPSASKAATISSSAGRSDGARVSRPGRPRPGSLRHAASRGG